MIDNLCCICLENNSNTIKCTQCVNKFHSTCIISWGLTLLNNQFLLFNLNSILNVSCPCCRIIIHDNTIKLKILSRLFIEYKYTLFGFIILFVLLFYLLYICGIEYPIETFVMLYYISNIFIAICIEKICDHYNIILFHPFFDDFD
jgi:hypothetical protein